MALIPDPNPGPEMRTLEEVRSQLRAVRRQYRKGFGPQRDALRAQHDMLCWVLGATREQLLNQKFLGGILNVDF